MNIFASRSVLIAAASTASVFTVAIPAHAFEFKLSGQVDKAMVAADNGEDSDVGFVDNNGSNTRFRFTGSQDLDNGMEVGFNYEIALTNNISTNFDINKKDTSSHYCPGKLSNKVNWLGALAGCIMKSPLLSN